VCTVPLPPGVNPTAVDEYIKYQIYAQNNFDLTSHPSNNYWEVKVPQFTNTRSTFYCQPKNYI